MNTPREVIQQAVKWAVDTYEERTRLVAEGKGNMYWISPNQRVDWHEICSKFGMKVMGPNDRTEFQPLFEKEMKKRNLWQVLKGKLKSDQWVSKFG